MPVPKEPDSNLSLWNYLLNSNDVYSLEDTIINPKLYDISTNSEINDHRKGFLSLEILNRIEEPHNARYSQGTFKDIYRKSIEHYLVHREEKQAKEHIILVNPFMSFLVNDTRKKLVQQPMTSKYASYIHNLFTLLETVKSIPDTSVVVYDKPDMYTAGTSYLVEQGLVSDVIFTTYSTNDKLSTIHENYSGYLSLFEKDIYLAGQYMDTDIAQLVTSFEAPNVFGEPQGYTSINYLKDLLIKTPKLFRFPSRTKKNSLSSSRYIAARKHLIESPETIPLKTVYSKSDDNQSSA